MNNRLNAVCLQCAIKLHFWIVQYYLIFIVSGSSNANGVNDITQVPQLSDYLRFFKPKRFTLKSFKSLFFVCRDLVLAAYKSSDAAARGIDPVMQVNLKGCEVTPEVNLSQNKYQVKLEIPSAEGMSEMWLRFDTVSHFGKRKYFFRVTIRFLSLLFHSWKKKTPHNTTFLLVEKIIIIISVIFAFHYFCNILLPIFRRLKFEIQNCY